VDQQCSADLPTFCKLSHVDVCVKENVCYIAFLVLDLPHLQLVLRYFSRFFFPFSSSLLKCYLRIMSGKVGWLIMVPHSCNLYVRGGCESLRDPSQQILAVTSYILSTLKISCAS